MKKISASLLSVSVLFAATAVLGQAAPTPEFVMANNDLNKDGIITKEEATKAGKQLIQVWDTYDANKDGKVDIEEIKKGLAAGMGGGAPPAPAAAPAK